MVDSFLWWEGGGSKMAMKGRRNTRRVGEVWDRGRVCGGGGDGVGGGTGGGGGGFG